MNETPWDELEQAPLWIEDAPGRDARRAELDARRAEWIEARRRHAVGSEQEVEAWTAYRAASDRYWTFLGARGSR